MSLLSQIKDASYAAIVELQCLKTISTHSMQDSSQQCISTNTPRGSQNLKQYDPSTCQL